MPETLTISDRERDLVFAFARGLSEAQAAEDLGVTRHRVKNLADGLRWKLGVRTRREIPEAYRRATGESPYPE